MTGPRIPRMAPADGVRQRPDPNPQAKKLTGLPRILSDQIVQPMVDHPVLTALSMNPVGGAVMGGLAVKDIAGYAGQKVAEHTLNDHDRELAEADPDRIPGERAGVEAALLAASPLLHAVFKGGPPPMGEGPPSPRPLPDFGPKTPLPSDPEMMAALERPGFIRMQNRPTRGGVSKTGPFLQGDQPQGKINLQNRATTGGVQQTGPFPGGPRAGRIGSGTPGDLLTTEQRALLDRLHIGSGSEPAPVRGAVPQGAEGAEALTRLRVRHGARGSATGLGSPGYVAAGGGVLGALLGLQDESPQ